MADKDVFDIAEMRDHVATKGMWAGSLKLGQIKDFSGIVNGAIVPLNTDQVEALLKIINEIIVNATDHHIGCRKNLSMYRQVTKIDISYKNGVISVYNNGPGLPTGINKAASAKSGRDVYEPEVAFSNFMAGTNLVKDNSNVKGGTNGLGAKIANVHSQWFSIDTIGRSKSGVTLSYKQTWKNRMQITESPIIAESADLEYTRVTFLPAYAELGYKCGADGLPDVSTMNDILSWMHLHAHQSATYVGSSVSITFNDIPCRTSTVGDLADLLIARYCKTAHKTILHATSDEFPQYAWNIAVIVYPPDLVKNSAIQDMSIVNGVISSKGLHLTHFRKIIKDAVEEKVSKQAKVDTKLDISKTMQMQLVFCGAIPAADWNTQNKEEVCIDKAKLKKWSVSPAAIDGLAEFMAMRVMQIKSNTTNSKFIGEPKNYRSAHPPKSKKLLSGLMLAEGDSALSLLNNGLARIKTAEKPGDPSFEWFGTISLQGVILNAARGITEFKNEYGTIVTMSDTLKNNERLNAIASVIGLQFGQQTEDRLAHLNYGKLIICVDQDTDGTGKIAGLVLVWLYTCYPGLIESGMVYKFITPLIRAYPNGGKLPLEFYSTPEFKRWESTIKDINRYTIKYYKGLASHNTEESKRMFLPINFRRNIYKYTVDDALRLKEAFNIYYGKDSSLRKIALANPPREISYELDREMIEKQFIPLADVQLDRDVCEYKRDAISRQIPNCIDGLNPARRKVLTSSDIRLKGDVEVKVFQVCGHCADVMYYHHGDSSLNSTITYLAQTFYGARIYPMLLPSGQFGDRHGGEPGAPRYILVKRSPIFAAAYPREDKYLLDYVYEDGFKAEPVNLVPVLPMSILESNNNVSEGWRHVSYGRNLEQTIAAVKAYIAGDPAMKDSLTAIAKYPLDINIDKFKGDIRKVGKKIYSVGKYTIMGENKIRITELPIGLKTSLFKHYVCPQIEKKDKLTAAEIADITSKRYASEIIDYSNECDVDLELTMMPGWAERIKAKLPKSADNDAFDFVENGLFLKTNITPNLNYLIDGKIVEFESDESGYMEALLNWAPRRQALYKQRIERELEIATLLALETNQIITFINLSASIDLSEIEDDEAMDKVLAENNFAKMDSTTLHSPEDCKDIKNTVLTGPNSSYNFIKNLKTSDLVKSAMKRFIAAKDKHDVRIKIATDLLAERPVPCASLWLNDIDNFVSVYKNYRREMDAIEGSAPPVKKTKSKRT